MNAAAITPERAEVIRAERQALEARQRVTKLCIATARKKREEKPKRTRPAPRPPVRVLTQLRNPVISAGTRPPAQVREAPRTGFTALTMAGPRIAVTLPEATRLTGIKRGRLRYLMRKRILPFAKVRGLRVILKRALLEVLAADQAEAAKIEHRPKCRRCGRARVCRPRGLCWHCFYEPDVREQFEPIGTHGRRGVGSGYTGYQLPETPTTAPPGSIEKLQVLEHRAAARRALHHPADARFAGDPRPREFLQRVA